MPGRSNCWRRTGWPCSCCWGITRTARLQADKTLPLLEEPIPAGLPSELISRRPDLQQAWMSLLAGDAGVAIAHKQRFPRISLVAAGNDVSKEFGSLLNGSALAWSVLGNLTQPLF